MESAQTSTKLIISLWMRRMSSGSTVEKDSILEYIFYREHNSSALSLGPQGNGLHIRIGQGKATLVQTCHRLIHENREAQQGYL